MSRFADFGERIEYDVKEVQVPKYICKISMPNNEWIEVNEDTLVEYCLPQFRNDHKDIPVQVEHSEEDSEEANESDDQIINDPPRPSGLFHCTRDYCTKAFVRKHDLDRHVNGKGNKKCVWPNKTNSQRNVLGRKFIG